MKCACGCLQQIASKDSRGRPKRFVHGHGNKNKSNFWKIKSFVKKRTSHVRANKITEKIKCSINNNDCGKILEIAHLDGNPFNNDPSNLACLCASHHRLLDIRKLKLHQLLSMKLKYYVDCSGKRRYE